MKKSILFVVAACLGFTVACQKTEEAGMEKTDAKAEMKADAKAEMKADAKAEIATIAVADLAKMIDAKDCVVIDANGEDTRKEFGVIPGAVELASYEEYDTAKVLPEDKSKKLVFYCSSEKCMAAPKAAKRAMEAGYTNVSHLAVGIKGWVEAGQKVDKKG